MDADQEFLDDVLEESFFLTQLQEENPSTEKSEDLQTKQDSQEKEVRKTKMPNSFAFLEFRQNFEREKESEKKIRLAISFMRQALSQTTAPSFKDFWETRRLCLVLFKDSLSPKSRSDLWSEYVELSSEAHRLKEIFNEQSAFAYEQIDLAINALEKDLTNYDELLKQIPEITFAEDLRTLSPKKDFYNQLQTELYLLNTLAARVNSLRKEVIKTEIRIRQKNQLFERLSACGDRIYPKRKELIKSISDAFEGDVEIFVRQNFSDEKFLYLFALREEIKAMQAIAKLLTLNTHSFMQTRVQLSECWDKIKLREKERKKEAAEKKQIFKQNFDLALEKIKGLEEEIKAQQLSFEDAEKKVDEILQYMRTIELGREEVRSLKDQLFNIREPLVEQRREKEIARKKRESDVENEAKRKVIEFRKELNALLENPTHHEIEVLMEKRTSMLQEFETLNLNKIEKQIIDRLFKQLKDIINERKEKALLALSHDDLQVIEKLEAVLKQRKEERQEIKNQLENYRKALGGSGFDFEKAMMIRESIETEKGRLEKANSVIEEIEAKIDEIQGD